MTSDSAQWVRVEFYGRVPDGQNIKQVDIPTVSQTLMRAFGFTRIDGITACHTRPPGEQTDGATTTAAFWRARQEVVTVFDYFDKDGCYLRTERTPPDGWQVQPGDLAGGGGQAGHWMVSVSPPDPPPPQVVEPAIRTDGW